MSPSLFRNTPSVTVLDNRGLTVRDIAYHRHPDTPDVISELITRHQYDDRGFLTQSADPRLHEAGLANFTYLTDLTGTVLRTVSADAGTTATLNDAAGRQYMTVTNIRTAVDGTQDRSQAVTRTWQYEESSLSGRLVSVTEQVTGNTARITERFVYAGNTDAEKALNLAGQCVSHYDTVGLMQTDSIALTDIPLSLTRRLLKDADNPDAVADWQGADVSAWNDLLETEMYTTLTTADVTGAVLVTTDAKGNRQRVAYDVSGLLSGSWLTVTGGAGQVIVKSLTYSAAGQKLREEHGNGVVTTYEYEPETQRLVGIKTERPAGHTAGAKVLQDLRYEYDPVGNVLKIKNDAEETRFWRNQKVVPENTYAYDSLYQLVSATGREMATAGQQGSGLPHYQPFDNATYTNYTRTYSYDRAGNLTQIRHSAQATGNSYTTSITVSDCSNRSVLSTLTENPSDVDELFTAGGQQKLLQPGQTLVWTPRNELLKVTPVVRDGSGDDSESYRYDGEIQRILKVSSQKTGNSTQTQRVLYLPGLELCTTKAGATETESLQVMTVGEAGRAQVRVLHWESGQPPEITGDQLRYSYDNLIGSCGLEVDGEGNFISIEEYYPYGGTAVCTARSAVEADYKTVRYSGKERDATGLYYFGYRYYQPWVGGWLSADPAGTVDGLNLFRMVRNNPITLRDSNGLEPKKAEDGYYYHLTNARNLMGIVENGFIPQGSQGPTLSVGDLENRKKGVIRYIYTKVATELNRGEISKNKISSNNFKMPSVFWSAFKLEGYSITNDYDIESVNKKLNNSIVRSISAVLDKGEFKKKHNEKKLEDIISSRMRVMDDDEINKIITQKPLLEQQREAANTKGYIYLAATRNTLEKYAINYKSSNHDMILLAIPDSIFSAKTLEEDEQEPGSAVRYCGGVSSADLRFVNREGQVVPFESSASDEIMLDYPSVINFIRKQN